MRIWVLALVALTVAPAVVSAERLEPDDAPGVAIAHPADGADVPRGFTVTVDATDASAVADVELWIDGAQVGVDATPPYEFTAPLALADGEHAVEARAVDDAGLGSVAAVLVTVGSGEGDPPDDDDDPMATQVSEGCAAGGGGGLSLVVLALCALARARTSARRGSRGETGR